MTCQYLVSRAEGLDDAGRPVLTHGYPCGEPVIGDDACAKHLTETAGLSPRPLLPPQRPRP